MPIQMAQSMSVLRLLSRDDRDMVLRRATRSRFIHRQKQAAGRATDAATSIRVTDRKDVSHASK